MVAPDDLLVSVCDAVNEELGAVPNQRLHWSIPDPAAVDTDAAFATVLDVVRRRTALLAPHVRRPSVGPAAHTVTAEVSR